MRKCSTRTSGLKMMGFAWLLAALMLGGCKGADTTQYEAGAIAAFAEMVAAGVKPLALSEPLSATEMDQLWPEAEKIAQRYGVKLLREKDLLVTDLFAADVAKDKEVLLIGKPAALIAYQQLRTDQQALQASGNYEATQREAIARRFGRLLGYPPHRINALLAEQTAFRTAADFGLQGQQVVLYYRDLPAAARFYGEVLGLPLILDKPEAKVFQVAQGCWLSLVDIARSTHTPETPKTVAVALLTDQLADWYTHLQAQQVPIKYPYRKRENNAHDGFVAIDPEGYLLEFEVFKQHPENERFLPLLHDYPTQPVRITQGTPPAGLGFRAMITWVYYKDMLQMQQCMEEVFGLPLVIDQGWAKIYGVAGAAFVGLVDERRGMHTFAETKAVQLGLVMQDADGWQAYSSENKRLNPGNEGENTQWPFSGGLGLDPGGYQWRFFDAQTIPQ